MISQSSSPVLADCAAVSPAGAGGEALAKVFLLTATCALSCRYNIDPLLVEYDTSAQVTIWFGSPTSGLSAHEFAQTQYSTRVTRVWLF